MHIHTQYAGYRRPHYGLPSDRFYAWSRTTPCRKSKAGVKKAVHVISWGYVLRSEVVKVTQLHNAVECKRIVTTRQYLFTGINTVCRDVFHPDEFRLPVRVCAANNE